MCDFQAILKEIIKINLFLRIQQFELCVDSLLSNEDTCSHKGD